MAIRRRTRRAGRRRRRAGRRTRRAGRRTRRAGRRRRRGGKGMGVMATAKNLIVPYALFEGARYFAKRRGKGRKGGRSRRRRR